MSESKNAPPEGAREQRILAAAVAEFAHKGFAAASTNEIAKQAGVAKGLLFHYYGNKEKLYLLAVQQCVQKLMQAMHLDNMPGDESLIEFLQINARAKVEFFARNPHHYRLLYGSYRTPPARLTHRMKELWADLTKQGFEIISQVASRVPVREGVDRAQAVELIMMTVESIQRKCLEKIWAQQDISDENLGAVVDTVMAEMETHLKMILYGIAPKDGSTPAGQG